MSEKATDLNHVDGNNKWGTLDNLCSHQEWTQPRARPGNIFSATQALKNLPPVDQFLFPVAVFSFTNGLSSLKIREEVFFYVSTFCSRKLNVR